MNIVKQETTSMENLSNELIYEIFDYLDGIDVYNAFSNLNDHFQQLLKSPFVLYKMNNHHSTSPETCQNTWDEINRYHRQQIFSLDSDLLSSVYRCFSTSFSIDSSLDHLQSIVLYEVKIDEQMYILNKFRLLPCLSALTIETTSNIINLTEIYRLVFNLPVLKYYRFLRFHRFLPISLPIATDKFSSIEYLILDYYCTFNELSMITSYTPKLHHLRFVHNLTNAEMNDTISPMTLTNLTHFSIEEYEPTLNAFKRFISNIYTNIKFLRIIISHSKQRSEFNAQQWERFIVEHLSHIEELYFVYEEDIHDNNDYVFQAYTDQLNPFTSAFWMKKQWLFDIEVEKDHIKYSVRPYKKRWHEDIDHSKSTLLNLSPISFRNSPELLLKYIKRCLEISHIYHLEISFQKMSLSLLVRIINLLPELDSLTLPSVSSVGADEIGIEEFVSFFSTINRKKITKLNVECMLHADEIVFLMNLFPSVTYFQLDYVDYLQVPLWLREILIQINNQPLDHLRSLCLGVSIADDELIQVLYRMIDDEQLLINYTVKRLEDQIYVQWK